MMSLEEIVKHVEQVAYSNNDEALVCMGIKEYRELAGLLRELAERRKADGCEGCSHNNGKDYICLICKRHYGDKYVTERRTDK